jgi:hypothetical protein
MPRLVGQLMFVFSEAGDSGISQTLLPEFQ